MPAPKPNADFIYCLNCRYHLRGLTENRCPECGTPFDPEDPRLLRYAPHKRIRGWIAFLTMTHLLAAALIFFTLILPYHLTGRAAYDYGLSDQAQNKYDFAPDTLTVYNLPVIGFVLGLVGIAAVLSFYVLGPTAPICAIAAVVLMRKYRPLIPTHWSRRIPTLWILTAIPYLYMLLNHRNVTNWFFD